MRWIGIIVVSIVLLELLSRAISWQPARDDQNFGTLRGDFSANTAGDWIPNQKGVWVDVLQLPYYVATNRQGFRNSLDVDPSRQLHLFLGDSFTFGLMVRNSDVWLNYAERLVNARQKTKVQFLNNGLPGATIVDQREYLEEKLDKLTPHHIVIVAHANDLNDMNKAKLSSGFVRKSMVKAVDHKVTFFALRQFLRQNSGTFVLARNIKNYLLRRSATIEVEKLKTEAASLDPNRLNPSPNNAGSTSLNDVLNFEIYSREMSRIFALTEAKSIDVSVVYLPAPSFANVPFKRLLDRFVAAKGKKFLDLSPAIKAVDIEYTSWHRNENIQADYKGDGHLTRYGNLIVGKYFADNFDQLGNADD